MFWAILSLLLLLWYLGLITGYTMGGIIHLPLIIAVIILVIRLVKEIKHYSYLEGCRKKVKHWNRFRKEPFHNHIYREE